MQRAMDAILEAVFDHLGDAVANLSFTKNMTDKKMLSKYGQRIDAFIEAVGELGHPIRPERADDKKTKSAILRACVEYFKVIQSVQMEASERVSDDSEIDCDLTRKDFFDDFMRPLVANRNGKLDVLVDALYVAFVREARRPVTDVFRDIFQDLPDDSASASAEDDATRPPANANAPALGPAPAPTPIQPAEPTRARDAVPAIRYDDPSLSGFQKRMMLIRGIIS